MYRYKQHYSSIIVIIIFIFSFIDITGSILTLHFVTTGPGSMPFAAIWTVFLIFSIFAVFHSIASQLTINTSLIITVEVVIFFLVTIVFCKAGLCCLTKLSLQDTFIST